MQSRMLVIGDFSREEKTTIIREAELRNCKKIHFQRKNQKEIKWSRYNYIICSVDCFEKFEKLLDIANLCKVVIIVKRENETEKIPQTFKKCCFFQDALALIGAP